MERAITTTPQQAPHETALVQRRVLERPRVHLHYPLTSASWIDLVECWLSLLQRRALMCGAFSSTDEILASVERFCQRTSSARRGQATRKYRTTRRRCERRGRA